MISSIDEYDWVQRPGPRSNILIEKHLKAIFLSMHSMKKYNASLNLAFFQIQQ